MKFTTKKLMAVFSAVLMLPALFLGICGVLFLAFDLTTANDLIGSVFATAPGRILLSPAVALGGVLLSLVLNARALCRVRLGVDGRAVYLTVWIARAPDLLILSALAALLMTLLLAYGFVENFRLVPR